MIHKSEDQIKVLVNTLIGRRIKSIRKKKKIHQEIFAKAIDVTRATVSNIEGGKNSVSITTLYRVAIFFNIEILMIIPSMEEVFPHIPSVKDELLERKRDLPIQHIAETVCSGLKKERIVLSRYGSLASKIDKKDFIAIMERILAEL